MNEADARILTGDQGSGKTATSVALVIDDCFANITGLITPSGKVIKANPLTEEEIKEVRREKGESSDIPFRFMRVYSPDGLTSKITEKPKGWMIDSSIKVFSNFTFYGIRYVPTDTELVIAHMNDELMKNAWIVFDESIMTERRDTMSNVGKMMVWFGAQARRRNLHMVVISQYLDMVQSRFVRFATTKVLCSYNKEIQTIHLDVNRKSEVMRSCDYKASDYWRFYKHDEIVRVPQYRIDKVLKGMHELVGAS